MLHIVIVALASYAGLSLASINSPVYIVTGYKDDRNCRCTGRGEEYGKVIQQQFNGISWTLKLFAYFFCFCRGKTRDVIHMDSNFIVDKAINRAE